METRTWVEKFSYLWSLHERGISRFTKDEISFLKKIKKRNSPNSLETDDWQRLDKLYRNN